MGPEKGKNGRRRSDDLVSVVCQVMVSVGVMSSPGRRGVGRDFETSAAIDFLGTQSDSDITGRCAWSQCQVGGGIVDGRNRWGHPLRCAASELSCLTLCWAKGEDLVSSRAVLCLGVF